MSLTDHFQLMAHYNQWMNGNLYQAAATLSEAELHENRGAFFGSVLGTLNHILVGDTLWLQRFAEHPSGFSALDGVRKTVPPASLNTILYDDLASITVARLSMDETISAFCNELDDQTLESSLVYHNTRGDRFDRKLGFLVQHFFNHQTHHRGQVTTLLSQAGADVGVTDLLMCIPNNR
jgi:uncharacterized damage-inducible protein DinB